MLEAPAEQDEQGFEEPRLTSYYVNLTSENYGLDKEWVIIKKQ